MQLDRRHEAERRGTLNSAGLNLYSGSTVNHLRGADFRYGQDQYNLKGEYEGERSKLERQEGEAKEAREGAYREGREGAIGRLGEEELPVTPAKGKKKGGNNKPKKPPIRQQQPKHNGGNKKRRR